jgi:ABC-type transport system substrate-binding protein
MFSFIRNKWSVPGLVFALLCASSAFAADPGKVFRMAFEIAETTFDPQKIADVYSNMIADTLFDTPVKYDYLARPLKLKPNTLSAMPEITDEGKTLTLRVKPGIYFNDDAAFGGRKRELTAHDYVYSMKRLMDPKLAAPLLSEIEGVVLGSAKLIEKARKDNRLDYDAPFEGIRALDRYTWQIRLEKPSYIFIYNLADCRIACAVAREVVERYGDDVGSHPVGTGAYRIAFWKRSSKVILEPNPNFREVLFDGEPEAGDARGQEILARMKGKRLPLVGRIEINIIEEVQPRWLAFLNGDLDLIYQVPSDFAYIAFPNNKLAANLQRQGIVMEQVAAMDLTYAYFNMEDPTVGGYTPEKVALRRAISLAYNVRDEIAILRKGQAVPAQAPWSPGVAGYDSGFRTTANDYDVPRARALLDMFGYVDRDGDGYREMPDGRPLVLVHNSTPSARDQQFDELWKRSMDDIGVRFTVRKAKWPDLLKESYAGKLMMWQLGGAASAPDADTWLSSLYGPNSGMKGNQANFRHPEYDRLYEKARTMPDSPERTKIYEQLAKIVVAYAPWKINVNRILTDLWYPWVVGYRRPLVQGSAFWMYLDIDKGLTPNSAK